MRTPEHRTNLESNKFLLFLSGHWHSKTLLHELLRVRCGQDELKHLSYHTKISMLYGYDLASQFKTAPHVKLAMRAWKGVTQVTTTLAIPIGFEEKLAVEYVKNRLAVGTTYIVSSDLAALVQPIAGASTLTADCFPSAFFSPRLRAARLLPGDVAFICVNAFPERMKCFKASSMAASPTLVVVRAFLPCVKAGTIPKAWSLLRWDVRGWCQSSAIFEKFLGGLLIVTDQDDQLSLCVRNESGTAYTRPFAPRCLLAALPPDFEDEDADGVGAVEAYHGPTDHDILAILADSFLEGEDGRTLEACPWLSEIHEVTEHDMQRLTRLGAITCSESEEGVVSYRINPGGIQHEAEIVVERAMVDMHFLCQQPQGNKDLPSRCKLELLLAAFGTGFRPASLTAASLMYKSGEETLVNLPMLRRSKEYLQALIMTEAFFAKGLARFYHAGPQYYYLCLLNLPHFDEVNAIEDVSSVSNQHWKKSLKESSCSHLVPALEDGPDDDGEALAVVPVPPAVAVEPKALADDKARLFEPMSFCFDCETTTGIRSLTISLDGCSHQSGRRRIYADCIHEGHERCRHYLFLHKFAAPWQACAALLVFIRAGITQPNKARHFEMDRPTDADLNSVLHEMPEALFHEIPDKFD